MFIQPCNGQLLCQYVENAPTTTIVVPDGAKREDARPFLRVLDVPDDGSGGDFIPGDVIWTLQANFSVIDSELKIGLTPACAVLYLIEGDPTTSLELQTISYPYA